MDIRDILKSFDNLSEGEKTTTDKGTVHKATAGGYGNQHGTDDVKDQYGKPIGKVSLGKLGAQNEPKRGKGRPPNPDKAKSYDSTALNKAMGIGKAPKATGKPSVKHSLKEYFDQMDQALVEAGAIEIKPASQMPKQPGQPSQPGQPQQVAGQPAQNTQVIAQGNKTLGTVNNPQLAQQIKQSIGKGEMTLMPDQQMAEDGENWIKGAVKHPGAFTAKAKSHGMTPAQFRDKVLSHKEDYPAKTEKQAQLAKTLSKMHEEDSSDVFSKARNDKRNADDEMWAASKFGNKQAAADVFSKARNDKRNADDEMWAARQGVKEAEAPQHFAQSSPISTGGRNPNSLEEGKKTVKKDDRAEKDGKKVTKDLEYDMGHKGKDDKKAEKAGKKVTKDIEYDDKKKKIKEAAKPDFLDLDKDGNKKEPMKTAAKDKKKVKEGMEHHLQAARLEGKSHALRKMPYNCTHDDMEEARCYHDGFKEGLDECYGQMPILGRTAVGEMGQGPEVATMASYGADDMGMDEGNAFTSGLAKTPHGGKFKVGGSTFTDRTRYDAPLDEFAFESLDKQLNSLLESEEKVSEGMTVSISKGQQGSPDSVSVSAQDGEADQLLSIIKSAGMGLFGGDEQNGYGAPQGSTAAPGGIEVVDDHDGMMALMKKLSGGGDYEDEEGHGEEEHMHGEEEHSHEGGEDSCNECGMAYESCACDHDEAIVDEEESEDQMAYEVAEANAPDSGADNTNADVAGNAAANSALATDDAAQDEEDAQVYSSPTNEDEDETGEEAGKKEMSESSFFNLFRKIAMLSEESTSEKDDKAEKAAKEVAKDIEYDEGHKGKDDNKAEKAGEKVKKDIEYDDKKDKKEKKLDEWANEAGKNGTDASFEADIDFMTKVISGGLNKQKSTGQTTIPVIAGQQNRMGADGLGNPLKESTDLLKDYRKLSGL